MRKTVFLSIALATAVAACGRTPLEAGDRAQDTSTIQANNIADDSATARGGNLMGSGH